MAIRFLELRSVMLLQTFSERLALFVLPLYVYQLTGSKQVLGIIVVLEWLPTIALLPIAGRLVDKFGCRNCFVGTSIIRAFSALILALATSLTSGVGALMLFAVLASAANIIAYLSFEKYVASQVPEKMISGYYSFFSVSQQINQIVAPLAGTLVMTILTVHQFFIVYLACFTVVATLFHFVISRDRAVRDESWESVSFIALASKLIGNRKLVCLALCMLLINISLSILITLIPDIVIGVYGLNKMYVASLFVVSALLSWALHTAYSRAALSHRMRKLGEISPIAIPALLILQLIHWEPLFFVISALTMAISLPFSVWSRTLRNTLLPKEEFATAASLVMIISLFGYLLGGLIISGLPMVPDHWIMFVSGVVVFGSVIIIRQSGGLLEGERAGLEAGSNG